MGGGAKPGMVARGMMVRGGREGVYGVSSPHGVLGWKGGGMVGPDIGLSVLLRSFLLTRRGLDGLGWASNQPVSAHVTTWTSTIYAYTFGIQLSRVVLFFKQPTDASPDAMTVC